MKPVLHTRSNSYYLILLIPVLFLAAESSEVRSEAENLSFSIYDKPSTASDLRMANLEGSLMRISGLRGNVVLLNFWRKDCRYCVQEKKHLNDMVDKLERRDLKVLCVDLWDDPSWVRSYARRNEGRLLFASKMEGGRAVVENSARGRHLGYFVLNEDNEAVYEIKGFPSTYVIDKQGRVIASHLGMVEWNAAPVRKWLDSVLGPNQASGKQTDEEYRLPVWLERILNTEKPRASRQTFSNSGQVTMGPTR